MPARAVELVIYRGGQPGIATVRTGCHEDQLALSAFRGGPFRCAELISSSRRRAAGRHHRGSGRTGLAQIGVVEE
jgi:hypothetical protein